MTTTNMKAKYESLAFVVLKDLAKVRGIKGISRLKKGELVEAMLMQDEIDAKKNKEEKTPKKDIGKENKNNPKKNKKEEKKNIEKEPNKEVKEDTLKENKKENKKENTNEIKKVEKKEKSIKARKNNNKENKISKSSKTSKNNTSKNINTSKNNTKKEIIKSIKSEKNELNDTNPKTEKIINKAIDNKKNTEELLEKKSDKENYEQEILQYDDLKDANGILETLSDGYGFIRSDNYLPGENDVYVSPSQIRKFNLKTGDVIKGKTRKNNPNDKYGALLLIETINDFTTEEASKRKNFEDLIPIFPDERIKLETENSSMAMRIVDLFSPIGKGQRGMIVSQPKAGKTTLLKQVAKSVKSTHKDMHIIVLLIDERPEEVTDMKESIEGNNVEVIYSTFDELPEHHKRVSEMVIERAKRLVEHGKDVMILLDSITRLSRAYNLTVPPSGRTLSGGLDPAALHMPKKFFGAARNMREGGSLTILATALVDTGSKMDDVVYEEFKGTGNMELILDRKLSERRVFPAIELSKSGTRREDLLLNKYEREAMNIIHRGLNGMKKEEATENILHMMTHTKNNAEFVGLILKRRML